METVLLSPGSNDTLVKARSSLLVVGKIVLHAGSYILALNARNQSCGNLPGKQRILREILEIPAAQRAALDVGSGAKDNAHLLCPAFLTQSHTHSIHQGRVKAACRREACCGHGGIQPQMVGFPRLLSQTVRVICATRSLAFCAASFAIIFLLFLLFWIF